MGFLGRLFARKTGGTRVGNLLRQVAYNNTYTLLGSNQGGYKNVILENDGADGGGQY